MTCSIVVASRFLAVGAGVPSARGDLAVATQAFLQAGTPAANVIAKLEQARMKEGKDHVHLPQIPARRGRSTSTRVSGSDDTTRKGEAKNIAILRATGSRQTTRKFPRIVVPYK